MYNVKSQKKVFWQNVIFNALYFTERNIVEMGKIAIFFQNAYFHTFPLSTTKKMKFLEERKNVTITSIFIIA